MSRVVVPLGTEANFLFKVLLLRSFYLMIVVLFSSVIDPWVVFLVLRLDIFVVWIGGRVDLMLENSCKCYEFFGIRRVLCM